MILDADYPRETLIKRIANCLMEVSLRGCEADSKQGASEEAPKQELN